MNKIIRETKQNLQQAMQQKIHTLDARYWQEADKKIFQPCYIYQGIYKQAKTIFMYVGRRDEINTIPIIEQAWRDGKRVGVSLCTEKEIMEVWEIKSRANL